MSKPTRIAGKCLASLALAASVVFGNGCGKRMHVLEIELDDATFSNANEKVRLHLRSDKKFRMFDGSVRKASHPLYVHGHNNDYEVVLVTMPPNLGHSYLYIGFSDELRDSMLIDIDEAFYTVNGGVARPLQLQDTQWIEPQDNGFAIKSYQLQLPAELLAHGLLSSGDGLQNVADYQDELEQERYRYVIKMRLNEEPYSLDVTLGYRIGTRPLGGTVGMP